MFTMQLLNHNCPTIATLKILQSLIQTLRGLILRLMCQCQTVLTLAGSISNHCFSKEGEEKEQTLRWKEARGCQLARRVSGSCSVLSVPHELLHA